METTTAHTRPWHPFAAMGKVDGHELVLTRGEGCRLWDADGHEYLDAPGLWFVNVGARSRRDRRGGYPEGALVERLSA
jgi:putrescine---pyruvate transaminase